MTICVFFQHSVLMLLHIASWDVGNEAVFCFALITLLSYFTFYFVISDRCSVSCWHIYIHV